MKRLYHATLNTIRGFAHAFRTEQAFRQEVAVLLVGLPIGIFVAPSAAWYVAMIGSLLAIMAVELLNTGIEKLADHIAPEWDPKIRVVKDYGSAAVFCALVLAGLVWIAALALRFGLI
ncbi:MAG TPA: diacylglycerol kinase [Xanthobacteraceae bacterium]